MVGLIYAQTPPTLSQTTRYEPSIRPHSLKSKKRKGAQKKLGRKIKKRTKKGDAEMNEAAEALLSVSPELKAKEPENAGAKISPLSFLCSIATSFSIAPGVNSTPAQSKGSLAQSMRNGQSKIPRLTVLAGMPAAKHSKDIVPQLDDKCIGWYTPTARRKRLQRFLQKRQKRVWVKKVRYSCRKNLADGRIRVKGRFVSAKK